MKKKLFMVLACFALMFLSFGLVACGESEVKTYQITVDDNIQHGEVLVLDSAKAGESVYIEVVAEEGWGASSVAFNYQKITIDDQGFGHFVMPSRDVLITAVFKELRNITVVAENGGIQITSPASKKAVEGQTVTGKVTANGGYVTKSLKMNDDPLDVSANGSFSFVMPDEDVNLVAEFAKQYKVETQTPENGTLKLRYKGVLVDNISLTAGTEIEVVVTPSYGYKVGEVKYTTGSEPKVLQSPYKFFMPEGDVVVSATFVDARGNINLTTDEKYTITITSHPEMKALQGETVKGKVALAQGQENDYEIVGVTMNTQDAQFNAQTGEFSFTMPEGDVSVAAKVSQKYTVEVENPENGTLKLKYKGALGDSFRVIAGTEVEVVATADANYKISEIKYTVGEQENTLQSPYKFSMPEGDIKVSATFVDARHEISVTNENCTITITSHPEMKALPGETVKGKVVGATTPEKDYDVTGVMANLQAAEFDAQTGEFSFVMPDDDVTVTASVVEHEYSVEGFYICTAYESNPEAEVDFGNNFLYFEDGKFAVGMLIPDETYFFGEDFAYSLNKNILNVQLPKDQSEYLTQAGISIECEILRNGDFLVKYNSTTEEKNLFTMTFTKSEETVEFSSGKYTADMTGMISEHQVAVLESDGNIFIVASDENDGRDLGKAYFYGNMMIIQGYDDQLIVGKFTNVQENSYTLDAVDYYWVDGYYEEQQYHDGHYASIKITMTITRVGDFDETKQIYTMTGALDDYELGEEDKHSFVMLQGGYATVGCYISEDFGDAYLFEQYIPYTTDQDGTMKLSLHIDLGDSVQNIPIEAKIVDGKMNVNFNQKRTYQFTLDSNTNPIEQNVEYVVAGYEEDDLQNGPWYFVWDGIQYNIFQYNEQGERNFYTKDGEARVIVYADHFVAFNEEGFLAFGTISSGEGNITITGFTYYTYFLEVPPTAEAFTLTLTEKV